jgi:hypothetical protein
MSGPLTEREQALLGPRHLKPFGSPEWCWQTVTYLKDLLGHVNEEWQRINPVLGELEKAKAWEKIPPGQPYGTLDRLLMAEAGLDRRSIKRRLDEIRAAQSHGGARRVGESQGDTITLNSTGRGTSVEYTVARLKRDAGKNKPDPRAVELLPKVLAKEMSPSAAARAMGWRPERVTLIKPETVARKIRENFTAEQIARLIALLLEEDV